MTLFQWTGGLLLVAFYAIYFAKMLLQRRQGIQTDQMGKGDKAPSVLCMEWMLKIITYGVAVAEAISVLQNAGGLPPGWRWAGAALAALGVLVFGVSVWTLGESWRAGIPAEAQTELVVTGLYRYSRNPAFLGFDLMYAGMLLLFFNGPLCLLTLAAMGLLHVQILQEEAFLEKAFGQAYWEYKRHTLRYLGRR